ncbi:leaf rust 10 disease-resistance locus receptor-like protein kinase-like 2.7, partial [Quercus suber]
RPFDCGRIKNISYPFLRDNRPEPCGIPEFKLTCRDNEYPIISFKELEILVLNINQSHYIMTIARWDLWNSPCLPTPKFVNTTLDFNNFDYHKPTDQNLTLFYGCPYGVSGLDKANYFPCGLDNIYFVSESFTGIDELFEKCHRNIRVPVLGTALKNESLGLQKVLNQGFDVDYHNFWAITCLGCEASGGICGFNSSSHPFVCLCRDGDRQPLFCSIGTVNNCIAFSRRFTMSQFLSYLLILSFFFFFFINSLGTNSSPLLEICPLHLCGDVDISYPFWVLKESASDQQQYCGYPGFGVMCLNGTAELELHGDRYHVKDINYADYTLSLVDIDVSNQTCPRARHNVSLETLPLKYSSMDLNLSYYFNCISYPPTVPFIPCLNISSNRSYVFVENHETVGFDWSKNCEQKVVVTVRQTQINMNNLTGGFGVAMNDGFLLDWQRVKDCGTCESSERYWETVKDCATCEKSEGYCGYNATAEEFLCFCNDGIAHGNSCKDTCIFSFIASGSHSLVGPLAVTEKIYIPESGRPFDCGRIKNISYPFLRDNRPEPCGIPEFKLTCRDNECPIISFKELEILVLNINQSHYIMTIARWDLWNSPCPPTPKFVNTTLDFNNFDYHTPTDQNLTLFYGCPSGVSGLDKANYFPCGLDNIYFVSESFTGIDELFEKCHRNIRVLVLGTALKNESLGL